MSCELIKRSLNTTLYSEKNTETGKIVSMIFREFSKYAEVVDRYELKIADRCARQDF